MEKLYSNRKKNYIAGILLLLLLTFAAWFIFAANAKRVITQYSSEYVALAELPSQLSFTYYEEDEWAQKLKEAFHEKNLNGKLTYGKLKAVLEQLSLLEYITCPDGFFWKTVPRSQWNEVHEQILDLLDTRNEVSAVKLVFLTEDETDMEQLLTNKGTFEVAQGVNYFHYYDMYQVYVKERRIIGVNSECQSKLTLKNVFIHSARDEKAEILYEKQKISLDIKGLEEEITDTICDIEWKDRKVIAIYKKEDTISGKVLSFDDKQIEISGYGTLKHSGKLRVYKTYGTVEELDESKLVIGNLEAEFVVAKKQVCGIILQQPATIENIRVLLLGEENSPYRTNPVLVTDAEGTVTIGDKEEKIEAGQLIKPAELLDKKKDYVKISLSDGDGRIYFADQNGEYSSLGYRGIFEIRKYPEGYGVVNELPLEQYLYGVVPSEMPASYERDALCTQAVCARSYACIQLMRGDYAALGAHVDDTTNYQVYRKQEEDPDTNLAVDDTVGEVVKYQGEVAETYFFSTSCGITGDMSVWNAEPGEETNYLQGTSLLTDGTMPDISDEEKFAAFIKDQKIEAYDSVSPYFRWNAKIAPQDRLNEINEAVAARYQAYAANVQIIKEDGTAGTEADLSGFGAVLGISVSERCKPGAASKLEIAYEKGSVTLLSEYNIRFVLGKAVTELTDKDGKPVKMELLPSAYCSVVPVEGGYVAYGGGYGHGIGMCQNAANGMAKAGMSYIEILMKFYHDIEIENIYNSQE